MQNQIDYQYEIDEEEERRIINFIKICRLCDNLKLRHKLEEYKVCTFCRNEIFAIRNGFILSNLAKYYKKQKRLQAKRNVVLALFKLKAGIKSGIHQNILDYIL